jgi:hypothetical protein
MPMTDYLRKKLGDHAIGKASFSLPTVYLALFTASPGVGGSLVAEVVGGSYARIELTSKLSLFDLTTGISANATDVTFATPTANWGTLTYIGVIDALTSGNVLFFDALAQPILVISGGRVVSFIAGTISITL